MLDINQKIILHETMLFSFFPVSYCHSQMYRPL